MNPFFNLNNDNLGRLDASVSTLAFRSLLWCEAIRVGLSPHKVIISLRTNVSDGGIDARIDGQGGIDSLLCQGVTYFQVKAGQSFKPWTKSQLQKELFGSVKEPSKKSLAPLVRECLDLKGRYVLVSFGHDLTPQQQSKAKTTIADLLKSCGYKKANIEVIGQGQLLGLFSLYPSLTLQLLGRRESPFLYINAWKELSDMTPRLNLAAPQNEVIEKIRAALRGTDFQHVRVIGEPGIGKTRLVLEALTTDDLSPLVLYVPHAEDFQRSQLFNELLRGDVCHFALIVVDECAEKDRASIWNSLKGKKNVKLITIDHGPERSRDEAMLLIDCPPLPEDQVKAIIESYLPKSASVSHWVEWCDGSPRVAHAVGENLKQSPDDLLKPPATVPMWERFVAGYDRLDSKQAQDALTVLRHVALFKKFGFEEPVSDEARFISQIIQDVDPAITWPRFQEIVTRLRERRILQGKRTLFIVPKALHIYLWIGYWNNYGRGFDFEDFLKRMPSGLQHWFLQLFIYAHVSPVARDIVRNILSARGPFHKKEFLMSEAGTRFLGYLAEADPGATLLLLEQTLGTWPRNDLKGFETGRQNIVWALEKIAVWREYFLRAAHLLIKLSLAENSNYSNNATGTLHGLFKIGIGWAATQASHDERFPLIEELLSNDLDSKELGLSLCKQWLSTHGGIRIVGPEYQGLRPEIEFWRPKTWGEIFNAWKLVWRLLFSVSRAWEDKERCKANNTMIETGFPLLRHANIADEVMEILLELAEDSATDVKYLTHILIQTQRFRVDKLPKGILNKLRQLDKKLTGDSFWGRFSRYVLNTTWDEDHVMRGEEMKPSKVPLQRVRTLVREMTADIELFYKHLPKLVSAEGHRLYQFGAMMAEELESPKILEAVLAAQIQGLPQLKTQFIRGYFSGMRNRDRETWESAILDLFENETTTPLGIQAAIGSGITPAILRRLLSLYKAGKVESDVFGILRWQINHEDIPSDLVEEVLSTLVRSSDENALRVAIEIADSYFLDKEKPRACEETVLFSLLTADIFFCGRMETMVGYHWHSVAKGFIERFPERDLDLFSAILSHVDELSSLRSMSYPSQIADIISKKHPDAAWAMISKMFEERENIYRIVSWLGDDFGFGEGSTPGAIRFFDPNAVIAWIALDSAQRARKLLPCLPKTLDERDGGGLTRLFIERFGNYEELSDDLISHFWTGGWSGPESAYLSRKRENARRWISETKSSKILSWLYRYVEYLSKRITSAEIHEEREF